MHLLSQNLRFLLTPIQDPLVAAWQAKYMRNQFLFLGVTTPQLKKAIRSLLQNKTISDWRPEAMAFWQEPEREFHYAAIYWAVHHRSVATEDDLSLYEKFVLTNSWWDTVDTIAPHLMGDLFLRFPELVVKTEKWVTSQYLWLRRAALIYSLRWKEKTDENRLFSYCAKLKGEKEFFIRKAIGWALREYSKTNPAAVRRFLEKTALSPLSEREAKKYLSMR